MGRDFPKKRSGREEQDGSTRKALTEETRGVFETLEQG